VVDHQLNFFEIYIYSQKTAGRVGYMNIVLIRGVINPIFRAIIVGNSKLEPASRWVAEHWRYLRSNTAGGKQNRNDIVNV
jgi:hypothetical protein